MSAASCFTEATDSSSGRSAIGAVSREREGYFSWATAASASVQRPASTSEKSISARSLRPSARSRLRSVTSQSMHSTRWPMEASASEVLAVKVVFPVPPLPDTTAMILPMETPFSAAALS